MFNMCNPNYGSPKSGAVDDAGTGAEKEEEKVEVKLGQEDEVMCD